MNKQEKREEGYAKYIWDKVLARAGEYLKPKWPKGFTKKIERGYMDALRTLVSREGEANDLIAGAWDEFDRPLGLSLD